MPADLYPYQEEAVAKLKNGSILCGGVGSGKSRTALAYYFATQGGHFGRNYIPMKDEPRDLYIITTAKKRDSAEWEAEMLPFLLSTEPSRYKHKVVVDSWNNIKRYKDVYGAFFIFDEQRVVGYGAWVKAFLNITRKNNWILLSATPGDTWSDYVPVFIANGFYRNKTEFNNRHVVYSRFSKYPKIDHYIDTGVLTRYCRSILVNMDYHKPTTSHNVDVFVDFDRITYKDVIRNRWNPYTNEPIVNASDLCYTLRRLVNSDPNRIDKLMLMLEDVPKAIIFYNFDYELEILRQVCKALHIPHGELNGHKHDELPIGDRWAYLVQYAAGCEAWNCIQTDTIIFYSQNYSYKVMIQASGRIDRMNTPYNDLYYYHLKSRASIDLAIAKALQLKKKFNENNFAGRYESH